MKRDQIARMIESLEVLKRASQQVKLHTEFEADEVPCAWWVRDDD